MDDLISKSAALDNAWQVMYKDEWHMSQTEQVVSVNDIEALPTIDAVPVVRCAECISFDTEGDGFGICQLHEMTRREEHFCSDGKRSEASLCDNCDERSENCCWCERMERSE